MPTDALHARVPHWRVALRHRLYSLGLKSAAHLPLPDFLGIGAQKAGTSWLHANLQVHPRIFMPPEAKEVHFFDRHILNYGLDGYSSLFRDAGDRIKGEITPAYGVIESKRIRFIRAVMPGVKLIFLMRNPIDRAWSQALMELSTKPGRPFEQITDEEFINHFRGERSSRRGNYESILSNWLGVFPREQLFIGMYDDIATRPRELLTEVFAFLGAAGEVDWNLFPVEKVVFKGPPHPLPQRLRQILLEMYHRAIKRLGEKYGAPAEKWLAEIA